jgi:hypothetical protein
MVQTYVMNITKGSSSPHGFPETFAGGGDAKKLR